MMQAYKNFLNNQLLPLLVVLCAFSIPLKTGVFSVFVGLLIITWVFSGEYRDKFQRIADNQVAVAAILLFLVFTVGLLYGDVALQERMPVYFKYHKLLYIPIVISVIRLDHHKRWAMNAFLISCLLVLLLSYLEFFSVIPFTDAGQGYVVTKTRITHNILMVYAIFLMLPQAFSARGSYRYVWWGLIFLATFNVLVMVNGVTGQLALPLMLVLFLVQVRSSQMAKLLLVCLLAVGLTAYFSGVNPNNRVAAQFSTMHDANTSSGQRLDFYKNTFELIKQSPLYGNGSGSFKVEYKNIISRAVDSDTKLATTNPHNEYLLIASQVGLIGLVLFIYILIANLRKADDLRFTKYGSALQGLVLLMAFGCLFNSLLMDAGEGRFYTVMSAVLASSVTANRRLGSST